MNFIAKKNPYEHLVWKTSNVKLEVPENVSNRDFSSAKGGIPHALNFPSMVQID